MSNHQTTTPTTNAGTSKTQQNVKAPTIDVDTITAERNQFLSDIAVAQQEGAEWVETSDNVIDFYNRKGLNGAKFFIFHGIKVCKFGESEKIEEEMHTPIGQKIFGKGEGKVG